MSHRRGESNTGLIIILGIAVVGIMVCCGGGYFAFIKVGQMATEVTKTIEKAQQDMNVTDPAKIDAVRAEIATIDLPIVFKPEKASTVPFINAHRVIYRAQGDQRSSVGFLTMADASEETSIDQGELSSDLKLEHAGPAADSHIKSKSGKARTKTSVDKKSSSKEDEDADAGEEDEPKAKDGSGKTPSEKKSKDKDAEAKTAEKADETAPELKLEVREPTINGKKARFQIAQVMGDDHKVKTIELFGEFRTKSLKYAQLKMQVTTDLVNYEQTIKLIDSIR